MSSASSEPQERSSNNYDAGLQASTQTDPASDSAVSSVDVTERAQRNPADKHGQEAAKVD